jgi:threonine dehydratase
MRRTFIKNGSLSYQGWVNPNFPSAVPKPANSPSLNERLTTETSFLSKPPEFVAITSEYLPKILNSQVYDAAVETPLNYAANISSNLKHKVFLKREDTQPVFSFKIRGAYNRIAKLDPAIRAKGVVTCSAGNHAQGVALSASKLGIDATIVMPLATPEIKVNAVRRFGGSNVSVVLFGKNFDEAAAEARRLVEEKQLAMIHPFDDPDVIAGQGTIAAEILKQLSGQKLDVVFACVGGGGMLSGIAAYVKALRPEVKVIGVEADDAAGMTESLKAGKVITLSHVGLFADGAAVKTVGKETFRICQQLVDEMITVSTDEICAAIKMGFNDTRCVLEPAGALAIAGMVKYARMNASSHQQQQTFVAVSSGANMDFDRLRFVSERADSGETLMSVKIPERAGAFGELYAVLLPRNVTEFSYRHNGSQHANVFVSFQAIRGKSLDEDKALVQEELSKRGYVVTDLSDNEMAKAHARHLAGGRVCVASDNRTTDDFKDRNELVFRFEFPEAPGALNTFLQTLQRFNQGSWSISLFHYRNHGHDFGRVLVGLLVKPSEMEAFNVFLDQLGYSYYDETNNKAYLQFLK